MATLKETRAAARRKYGKRCSVVIRTAAKSASEQELAKARRVQVTAAIKAIDEKLRDDGNYEKFLKLLCDAARFVCDTDGDKTAIEQLYSQLRFCEAHLERKADRRELDTERRELNHVAYTQKYAVENLNLLIPSFPITEVLHTANTLDELLDAIRGKQTAHS